MGCKDYTVCASAEDLSDGARKLLLLLYTATAVWLLLATDNGGSHDGNETWPSPIRAYKSLMRFSQLLPKVIDINATALLCIYMISR